VFTSVNSTAILARRFWFGRPRIRNHSGREGRLSPNELAGEVTAKDAGAAESRRTILRTGNGRLLTGTVAAIGLFFLIDGIASGAWQFVFIALPWMLLGVWVIYLLLARSCVILLPGTLEVVNVLRRHVVPWNAIDHLYTRYQLVITLRGGRRISSWGTPAGGVDRSHGFGDRLTSIRSRRSGFDWTPPPQRPSPSQVVERFMEDWPGVVVPDQPDLVSTWDTVPVIVTVALILLSAADLLVVTGVV
jgi:hypothetical protein